MSCPTVGVTRAPASARPPYPRSHRLSWLRWHRMDRGPRKALHPPLPRALLVAWLLPHSSLWYSDHGVKRFRHASSPVPSVAYVMKSWDPAAWLSLSLWLSSITPTLYPRYTVLCCTVQHRIIPHCTALHCTAPYCNALHTEIACCT